MSTLEINNIERVWDTITIPQSIVCLIIFKNKTDEKLFKNNLEYVEESLDDTLPRSMYLDDICFDGVESLFSIKGKYYIEINCSLEEKCSKSCSMMIDTNTCLMCKYDASSGYKNKFCSIHSKHLSKKEMIEKVNKYESKSQKQKRMEDLSIKLKEWKKYVDDVNENVDILFQDIEPVYILYTDEWDEISIELKLK